MKNVIEDIDETTPEMLEASGKTKAVTVKPRVQSVARAAKILFCVAESEAGMSAAEIRETTGLPTQATYHLLQTLQAISLLRRGTNNNYVLGLRVGDLIDGFRNHFSCPDELRSIVKRVAEKTGETSYASGWYDGDLVSLAVETGTNPIHASIGQKHLGGFIHARASGKLLLALSDESSQQAFFASHDLDPLTENTLTTKSQLISEFQEIRETGYALDREEYALGLTCLAVPVRLAGDTYALCVSGPTPRMKKEFRKIKGIVDREIGVPI
ncbi:IclR family transcriptional regulator [Thalassovita sp.]|uniref:IclR family transcriptional regulator n=1 Tax=Thalassovita sp. TaxID=1979401 RepID=UPI0029DE74FD|nr:IclR family transcriptional regulator [Thalassovita sp.]